MMTLTMNQKRAVVYFTGVLWIASPTIGFGILTLLKFKEIEELNGTKDLTNKLFNLHLVPFLLIFFWPYFIDFESRINHLEMLINLEQGAKVIIALISGYALYRELRDN